MEQIRGTIESLRTELVKNENLESSPEVQEVVKIFYEMLTSPLRADTLLERGFFQHSNRHPPKTEFTRNLERYRVYLWRDFWPLPYTKKWELRGEIALGSLRDSETKRMNIKLEDEMLKTLPEEKEISYHEVQGAYRQKYFTWETCQKVGYIMADQLDAL